MTRRTRAIAAKPTALRQWLTVAALLAFFLQSLAVQTHIHPADLPMVAKVAGHVAAPLKTPLKTQDPIDQCRLCQELVQAGAFIAPAVSVLPASLAFVPAVLFAPALPGGAQRPAFAWRSRAPPRA